MLVRVKSGLTLQETLDRLNADFDSDADLPLLRLAQAQRNEWDRNLKRISRDVGPLKSEEYLYSLTPETIGLPGRVQLDCCGDTTNIEVAYRHSGPVLKVTEFAYRIARIVEDESSVSEWAQHHLRQRLESE